MPSPVPISILIVDDEPRNLVALEAALGSIDCRLVKAFSGPEALGCLLAQDFALIVLDVHMPGMDGFETASLIRSRSRSESTPIIFLTADDRAGQRVLAGYRLGAVDYLYKPIVPDVLRAKVAIFVEMFRKTAALTEMTAELTRREKEVVALNADLEVRVLQRTAALETAIAELKREVAERQRAEATLDATEQRLRTVVNNTPVVLFALDAQGIFTIFEGSGLKALGMQPGQIVGENGLSLAPGVTDGSPGPAELIRPEDIRRALAGEGFTAVLDVFERVFEVTYTPHVDAAGVSAGATGIAVDMSEQRALARRKDAFVSTVSHELRTPLNGIIAVSQLLLGTSLDLTQQEYAEIIHRSGKALHRLIDDVLTLARYQSGKVVLEDLDLDVRLALEDVTALLFGPAREKGLGIVAHVDRDIPHGLRGDSGRLRQILLNLAGNALKFTDTGELLLRARLESVVGNQVSVRFEVQDTGIGIADEVQSRLFEPFEQADASTTTRYGGTGLGLAISRQLVESMGGQVGINSVHGSGSTFWFVLPLVRDETIDQFPERSLTDLSVLVVCDVPAQAAALVELLCAWNMHGTRANTELEATTLLDSQVPEAPGIDAVVIALADADGAGARLARRLQDSNGEVGQRVVLVAPVNKLATIAAAPDGAQVIAHPIRSAQLYDALAQLFGADNRPTDRTLAQVLDVLATPPGAGEHVLVVEDTQMNQLVARRALERLGYRVTVADSGLAALELLARFDYAVVLMDCRMPDMDGFEVTRRIRLHEAANAQRRTPVIALTANAEEGDRESCLAAGMDDYLRKPIDLEKLARAIHEWTN